jgi:hypothetical protein
MTEEFQAPNMTRIHTVGAGRAMQSIASIQLGWAFPTVEIAYMELS